MEVQLNELIEQIKKEGVEAAEAEAKSIIDSANADAEKIIKEAEADAETIRSNASRKGWTEGEKLSACADKAREQAVKPQLKQFSANDNISFIKKAVIFWQNLICKR